MVELKEKTDNTVGKLENNKKGGKKVSTKTALIICIIIVILSIVIYIPIRNNTSKEYNDKILSSTDLNKQKNHLRKEDVSVVISAMKLKNALGVGADVILDGRYIGDKFNCDRLVHDYYNVEISKNFFTGKIDKIFINSEY